VGTLQHEIIQPSIVSTAWQAMPHSTSVPFLPSFPCCQSVCAESYIQRYAGAPRWDKCRGYWDKKKT